MPKKKDIMEFAGAWKSMSDEEAEEMKLVIERLRKRSTRELLKEIKKINL